jgi:hypothetical protein
MPVDLLLYLNSRTLPLRMLDPADVRRASKLAAVGFVKAEILPSFHAATREQTIASATVLEITAEGEAEIRRVLSRHQETVPGTLPETHK